MRKNYLTLWFVPLIFLMLISPGVSNQGVNALLTTSQLTVTTQDLNGASISGMYVQLFQNGIPIASGYSPATFTLQNNQMYTVVPNNYLTNTFDHWLDTGSTNSQRNISISSDTTITAVYKTASTATTPGAPTGLTANTISSSQINLSWTAPSNNGGSAITGYKIYRGTTSNGEGTTPISTVSGSTLTYSDTGLTNGQTYFYKVTAVNSVSESAPSNEASASTPSAATVPKPPTGLTATAASSSQINLSWTAPANNGGSAITGYEIERARGNLSFGSFSNSTNTQFFSRGNTTSFGDTGLSPSTTYNYTVFAKNSVGASQPSNTASATTPSVATMPQPPTGLTATAASSSQINLSWTAPANNGGSAITGYEIERARGNLSFGSFSNSTNTQFFSRGNTTLFNDFGLSPSTTYNYTVFAKNSVGTSSHSNISSATTLSQATAPGSPTGLTATAASSSQINLSWTGPASNGGSAITGYKIDRSTDSASTWSALVANTGTTGTTYSDTGLLPNATYTYRVSAINSVGTSSPSNTATATTMAQCTACKLTITTQLDTGGQITGLSVELDQNGKMVSSGYSPVTFTLTGGAQYTVRVGNYNNYVFDHWSDTGSTLNPRPITISGDTQITGIYKDTALTLSPSRGPVGGTVSVMGITFSSLHAITLTWDGNALPTNPSTITSNLTGGFSASFQVPTSTVGSHKVQASDGSNTHSALFIVTSLTFTAPQPPTGLVATSGNTQVSLSWVATTDNGGSAITGYNIYRGTTSNGEGTTPIATVSSSTLTYADTKLTNGQTYFYKVTAINSIGESSPSSEPSATPAIPNVSGITVYAHRIPASYWDPCFATSCSAGTGPGAKMTFALLDSSGNVVQTGLADENGYTFTGLNSSVPYYVFPEDCDKCHISSHDVIFQYWGDNHSTGRPRAAAVGASLDAWYSCTNGCAGLFG